MERSPTYYRKGMGRVLEAMSRAGATDEAAIKAAFHFHPERQRFPGFWDYLGRCIKSIQSDWSRDWRAPPIRRPKSPTIDL